MSHSALQHVIDTPVSVVDHQRALAQIFDDANDAVIWNRRLPQDISDALSMLPITDVEDGRFQVGVDHLNPAMTKLFEQWDFISLASRWVIDDVQQLARELTTLFSINVFGLRVELVRHDACRKFHQDAVKVRMICTYSGPGTEYGVAGQNKTPEQIWMVPTGAPILLKGKSWPGGRPTSLFHRSPPIEGTGKARLVVVLEAAY